MVFAVSSGATVAIALVAAGITAAGAMVIAGARSDLVARRMLAGSVERAGIDADAEADFETLLLAVDRALGSAREHAIADAEAATRFQAAIDSLTDALLLYDENGALVGSNVAAATIIEARHGDALVGAALADLVRAARSGAAGATTLELFGPPKRSVVITTTPVDVPGGSVVVARVEDVTERRLLEAVRTDFVANISHELKTPIGAIGLLAETLEDEDDPAVAARLAGRIHEEALRVGRTIDDLLELSRIESALPSSREPVDLSALLAESVERIRPAAEQSQVEVSIGGASDGAVVEGDRLQLQSAVSNLLDNAVKYSDAGSTVDVSAQHLGESVVITITDRGIGIPTRDIERIFERFYRVDQARSRATGGTGLGLSIVRHIIENHGGTIEVESRLGEGSTFRMVLPKATVDRTDAEGARS